MHALILVDIQNDFAPGGALPVPEGDAVVPVVNALQPHFDLVVATQDWHPPDHGSFAANHPGSQVGDVIELDGLEQILWPIHCVRNTPGAEFLADLDVSRVEEVFRKGSDPQIDSYSGFFDNGHRRATGLGDYLRARGVRRVSIVGLATDYCVRYTALDAIGLGFEIHVIPEACRGIDRHPGDVEQALRDLATAGVRITPAATILG